MKCKFAILLIILLGIIPLYSDELANEEEEKKSGYMDYSLEIQYEPVAPSKKDNTVEEYKIKMISGIPDTNNLFDITDNYYNDPEKADLFLEAHFNKYDNPDIDPGMRIDISRDDYTKNKELYKSIRNKKLILTSTTAIFTKFSDINEYPTGGLLSKYDYNYDKEEFNRIFYEKNDISKYRWRIKGTQHYCPNIFMEGRIRISVPKKFARDLTGDLILFKEKKATVMGIFRIREKTKSHLIIEPVRYMLIWRKKKKIFTNFDASLDPAEMEKAGREYMKDADEDFGDAPDSGFGDETEDDFGDETDKKPGNKPRTQSDEKPKNTSDKKKQDDFDDEFGDFSEEE